MRLTRDISGAFMLLTLFACTATEIQTFPVTVSNAVSGKLETVPVTFRFGETTSVVERLDGTRFVPVPFANMGDVSSQDIVSDPARLALIRRLKRIQLPAFKCDPMTLSNAVEMIAAAVRRADTSTNETVIFQYGIRKKPKIVREVYTLPLDIPATNAFAVLRELDSQTCLDCPPVRKVRNTVLDKRNEHAEPRILFFGGVGLQGRLAPRHRLHS